MRCPGGLQPRYVRVTNDPVGEFVHLREIVVRDFSGRNLALGRPCDASSVYDPSKDSDVKPTSGAPNFSCGNAVDGLILPALPYGEIVLDENIFHSDGRGIGEFIEVDLGDTAGGIAAIDVYNRVGEAGLRLAGQRLQLLDARRREVFAVALAGEPELQSFNVSSGRGRTGGELLSFACFSDTHTASPTASASTATASMSSSRLPPSPSSTATATLSRGASASSSMTASASETAAPTPSPSPVSAAQVAGAVLTVVEAEWTLPRRAAAAPRAPVRIYHMQAAATEHTEAALLDAYLSPDLSHAFFIFDAHMRLDDEGRAEGAPAHEYACGGALADLPAEPPEVGPEEVATVRPCGAGGLACAAANLTASHPSWWTFHAAPFHDWVFESTNYYILVQCPLPAAAVAALRAHRAERTAAAPRTGLLAGMCRRRRLHGGGGGGGEAAAAAAECKPFGPRRVLAVDAGPATEQHGIAMWTMMFNKESVVVAWLSYYLALGVEHFYIYDQMSTDTTYTQLMPFVRAGVLTLIRANFSTASQCDPRNGPGATQDVVVNHLYSRWGAFNRWILLMDVDEYLVFPGGAAGAAWLRDQAGGGEASEAAARAAVTLPLATLQQLLRAINASDAATPPPFDGLWFESRYGYGVYPAAPDKGPPPPAYFASAAVAPICTCFTYYLSGENIEYAKTLVFKAHVPMHRSLHLLAFPGARTLKVHREAAVINHMVGCKATRERGPLPHIAACDGVARWAIDAVADTLLGAGLIEPRRDGGGGNFSVFRDGTARYDVVDRERPEAMRREAATSSGRCRTAKTYFKTIGGRR